MIGIINSGIGNIASIKSALNKKSIEHKVCISKNDFDKINKIILPGVGSFKTFYENLIENSIFEILKKKIQNGMPILGICLGYHALFKSSNEFGHYEGLGFVDGEVKNLSELNINLRIPHVGWNICTLKKKSILFENIDNEKNFYFTHSYIPTGVSTNNILGVTPYGKEIISAIEKDNIFGVQFHPEKSHKFGMQILKNFAEL